MRTMVPADRIGHARWELREAAADLATIRGLAAYHNVPDADPVAKAYYVAQTRVIEATKAWLAAVKAESEAVAAGSYPPSERIR